MKLRYKAIDIDGKTVLGVVDARDQKEAIAYLRGKHLMPIRIDTQTNKSMSKYFPFLHKSHASDVVFFTRQLSSMLISGLTLMQSLTILKEQLQNPTMDEVVSAIIQDIEEGRSFSLAISKYPEIFSSVYISSVKAAEQSGLLDKVLLRLAENLEKKERLKSTIRSALMYPSIVLAGMLLVVTIMMIFVIPQISLLYESLDIELPLPTLIVIGMSNFVINFWPLMIAGVGIGLFLFNRWHHTDSGKLIIDDTLLKLPIFGKLITESILTEFSRTFGLLVGSGTLVVEALRESADVAGNLVFKNAIDGVSKRVEKGVSIGDAMDAYPIFPAILVQTTKIGEETGKLDDSLIRVSDYFEREVDQSVKTLTTAMEPLIMIVLGIGVAFLIISIITPIYNLVSQIA